MIFFFDIIHVVEINSLRIFLLKSRKKCTIKEVQGKTEISRTKYNISRFLDTWRQQSGRNKMPRKRASNNLQQAVRYVIF